MTKQMSDVKYFGIKGLEINTSIAKHLPSGIYLVNGEVKKLLHGDRVDGVLIMESTLFEREYGEIK